MAENNEEISRAAKRAYVPESEVIPEEDDNGTNEG